MKYSTNIKGFYLTFLLMISSVLNIWSLVCTLFLIFFFYYYSPSISSILFLFSSSLLFSIRLPSFFVFSFFTYYWVANYLNSISTSTGLSQDAGKQVSTLGRRMAPSEFVSRIKAIKEAYV